MSSTVNPALVAHLWRLERPIARIVPSDSETTLENESVARSVPGSHRFNIPFSMILIVTSLYNNF